MRASPQHAPPYQESNNAVRSGPRVVVPVHPLLGGQLGVRFGRNEPADPNRNVVHECPECHAGGEANGPGGQGQQAEGLLPHGFARSLRRSNKACADNTIITTLLYKWNSKNWFRVGALLVKPTVKF